MSRAEEYGEQIYLPVSNIQDFIANYRYYDFQTVDDPNYMRRFCAVIRSIQQHSEYEENLYSAHQDKHLRRFMIPQELELEIVFMVDKLPKDKLFMCTISEERYREMAEVTLYTTFIPPFDRTKLDREIKRLIDNGSFCSRVVWTGE